MLGGFDSVCGGWEWVVVRKTAMVLKNTARFGGGVCYSICYSCPGLLEGLTPMTRDEGGEGGEGRGVHCAATSTAATPIMNSLPRWPKPGPPPLGMRGPPPTQS